MRSPHTYREMSKDQLDNIFSNYLIDSWSYSKVSAFARNEKAFEMSYIYRNPFKSGAFTIAGEAYHKALDFYFSELRDGIKTDLAALQVVAFQYIDEVEPKKWKIQKTTPSVEECIATANEITVTLLKNFLNDISVYESDIKEVLEVEYYADEFLTVNGVDIPLPCHLKMDLVVRTMNDKIAIVDHKSKAAYTDEKELKFSIGKQAITYALGYEAIHDVTVDEVWFVENKYSDNRDKSPQLSCYKMTLDIDTRRLYEAMLYEPLKRMLEAVSNPDYVYLINESDNFIDKAEIYEFWAQTMIAEIDQFNIPENKADLIKKRLKKIRDTSINVLAPNAIRKFREGASQFIQYDLTNKNMTKQEKIEYTLRILGTITKVAHTFEGYSSDTFLLEMSGGTSIASIYKYRLDISNALNVSTVRMDKNLVVYEGKSYVSIDAGKVREKDLMFDASLLEGRKIPLGFDNYNNKIIWDLDNPGTPHMLVGGATGSGKSVLLKSILQFALLSGFDEVKFFDPKYEFVEFNSGIVKVINEIDQINVELDIMVDEMQTLARDRKKKKILIIFDEFADALAQSKNTPDGVLRDLETNLRMILQKGRSIGYRVVAATQRASVKVITGDAKVNFPVQVCFRVPKAVDSNVMLDEDGAESLMGKGDGLLKSPQYPGTVRFQAFYIPETQLA